MKNLLSVLLITFLIAGCNIFSPGGSKNEDTFQPYKVGSFKFTQKYNADYIGIQNANKRQFAITESDTVDITQPDSIEFSIGSAVDNGGQNEEFLSFDFVNNYTRNRDNYYSTGVELASNVLSIQSISSSIADSRLSVEMDGRINCLIYNELAALDYIYVVEIYGENTPEKQYVYRLHADSAISVMNEFISCP